MIDLSIKKTITINTSASKVWEALVTPEWISQYLYGTKVITDWQVGGLIMFTGEWEGKEYIDKGTILELEEGKILSYSYWSNFSGLPDIPENYSVVTFKIHEVDKVTCRLTVVQENFANETQFEHSDQGWESVLNTLKELLEK